MKSYAMVTIAKKSFNEAHMMALGRTESVPHLTEGKFRSYTSDVRESFERQFVMPDRFVCEVDAEDIHIAAQRAAHGHYDGNWRERDCGT